MNEICVLAGRSIADSSSEEPLVAARRELECRTKGAVSQTGSLHRPVGEVCRLLDEEETV